MRRAMYLALAVLVGAPSCSSSDEPAPQEPPPDERPNAPAEWDRQVTRPDEAAAATDRGACKFKRGALPDETLGASVPVSADIPIDTIVVVMQENRSFDHYLGHFPKYAGRTDI